jgi:hypothetical protein
VILSYLLHSLQRILIRATLLFEPILSMDTCTQIHDPMIHEPLLVPIINPCFSWNIVIPSSSQRLNLPRKIPSTKKRNILWEQDKGILFLYLHLFLTIPSLTWSFIVLNHPSRSHRSFSLSKSYFGNTCYYRNHQHSNLSLQMSTITTKRKTLTTLSPSPPVLMKSTKRVKDRKLTDSFVNIPSWIKDDEDNEMNPPTIITTTTTTTTTTSAINTMARTNKKRLLSRQTAI